MGGWSYALDEGALTAVGRDGATHVLQEIDERSRYAFVHDGRKGMLLSNEGLWSVNGRRVKRIGDVPPALHDAWVHAMAITHEGAVIVSAGRSIYVGSAAGWSTVELVLTSVGEQGLERDWSRHDLHARAGLPDRLTRLVGGVPMGRVGSTDEVATAVLWLLSPEASYITGVIVPISGGR